MKLVLILQKKFWNKMKGIIIVGNLRYLLLGNSISMKVNINKLKRKLKRTSLTTVYGLTMFS